MEKVALALRRPIHLPQPWRGHYRFPRANPCVIGALCVKNTRSSPILRSLFFNHIRIALVLPHFLNLFVLNRVRTDNLQVLCFDNLPTVPGSVGDGWGPSLLTSRSREELF